MNTLKKKLQIQINVILTILIISALSNTIGILMKDYLLAFISLGVTLSAVISLIIFSHRIDKLKIINIQNDEVKK